MYAIRSYYEVGAFLPVDDNAPPSGYVADNGIRGDRGTAGREFEEKIGSVPDANL